MKAVVERSDDPVSPAPLTDPAPPPSRARFAAFAILFGLLSGAALFLMLAADDGWPALLLFCSLCLSLSCVAAMLVFRRMQLPLEAAHGLNAEQALRLHAYEDLSLQAPAGPAQESVIEAPGSAVAQDGSFDLRQAQIAADRQRCQTDALLATSRDCLLIVDRDGRIGAASPAAARLIGRTPAELLAQPFASLYPLFDDSRPEPLQHPLNAALQRLIDDGASSGAPLAALLERRGLTSVRLRLERQLLRDEADRVHGLLLRLDPHEAAAAPPETVDTEPPDPLTGAFGRQHLGRRIEQLALTARGDGSRHGLLLITPDHFDSLHDACGIAAGEQQLWQIAQAIRAAAAAPEDFCRISARHFALLLPRQPEDACFERAKALSAIVAAQVWRAPDGEARHPTLSIGVAVIDASTAATDALIAAAGEALLRARALGGSNVQLAVAGMLAAEQIAADWLRQKLASKALRLAVQAILPTEPTPGRSEGPWRALLLRIEDDDGSWLPIEPHAAMLERLGLTVQVDDWLLDAALRHDPGTARLSIPLFSASLLRDDFLGRLRARLLLSAVPTPQLCFAIDEAFILAHPQRAAALRALLSPFGCLLAIDEVRGGNGLNALRNFPAQVFQLHESLVSRHGSDRVDRAQLEALVAGARALGAKTVACAVRDADSRERMRLAKVDYVQGYAIAPPVPFAS
ncbi:EAL domain-containing protein [Nevskia sp.]|uniref:EAL domain-containing protein n=1 Tax=Nevskia sp. TaxID=1929292 RepID=UPI0025D7D5F9|nr:EAL domain-containing protein [Nevskia sp.]